MRVRENFFFEFPVYTCTRIYVYRYVYIYIHIVIYMGRGEPLRTRMVALTFDLRLQETGHGAQLLGWPLGYLNIFLVWFHKDPIY